MQRIGETLPGAAVRLLKHLELWDNLATDSHRSTGGTLSAWGSETLDSSDCLVDPDGAGARLDRHLFDRSLLNAAAECGVAVQSDRFRNAVRKDDAWTIHLRTNVHTSRWLIDATGRSAAIARKQGAGRLFERSLVAIYALGESTDPGITDRTLIESTPLGWWYGAALPNGRVVAGIHVRPADRRLLRAPGAWCAALSVTRHLSRFLANASFDQPPLTLDARGARQCSATGPGWIACGDAALSFDPLAGQGLFFALYSGMQAARTALATDSGDVGAMDDYTLQLDRIWSAYRSRRRAAYAAETRWPTAPFWSQKHTEVNRDSHLTR
jgi:flavin-dependent dehydrogenase